MRPDFYHLMNDPFPIVPSEEAVQDARDFLLEKWIERHIELGKIDEPVPSDLSDSCKFTSIFASVVFDGRISGNYDHVFIELDCGRILDLNADAADVGALSDAHSMKTF